MSDSEINNLINNLIENFKGQSVTGECIIILKNALYEESINGKIEKLEEVKSRLKSKENYCTLTGFTGESQINMTNNSKVKEKLIPQIDNTIKNVQKSLEQEAAKKIQAIQRGNAVRKKEKEKERLEEEEEEKEKKKEEKEKEMKLKLEAEKKKAETAQPKEQEKLEQLKKQVEEKKLLEEAMNYFDNDVKQENIAYEFISIEKVTKLQGMKNKLLPVRGGKKQAKKLQRRANKTKRVQKSNKKKRKPKRKTMRKIKKIIFR
jgi:hypothetical protein